MKNKAVNAPIKFEKIVMVMIKMIVQGAGFLLPDGGPVIFLGASFSKSSLVLGGHL